MTHAPVPATTTVVTTPTRPAARAALSSVLLGVAAPFAAYQFATALGASELAALAWGSVFPTAGIAVAFAARRRLDPVSALSLTSIAVGLAAGLLLHDAQLLLVKDSLLSATIGLAFLVSLVVGRPLVFVVGRAMAGDRAEVFDRRWSEPAFRRAMRRMSGAWAAALLTEATARVALSLLVPPATLLLVSPLVSAVCLGPVAYWTFRRRARMRTTPAAVR